MAVQWTAGLICAVARMIDQGIDYAALAERFGHRDGGSFRASFRKAQERAKKKRTIDSEPSRIAHRG